MSAMQPQPRYRWARVFLAALVATAFLVSVFARLGSPLMWNDEAETALYASHILTYGYPKVHDDKNIVYVYDGPTEMKAYDARTDAYLNTGWLQFYFAAPFVWIAEHTSDLYLQTAILRFPFSLVAVAALALLAWTTAALYRRRYRVWSAFFGLSALCIPLVLHMREVRYYAFTLLWTAGIVWLVVQRSIRARISLRLYNTLTVVVLVLTYITFHPLFFAFLVTLGMYALRHVRRQGRDTVREVLPLVIAGCIVLPGMLFFRTYALSHALNDAFGFNIEEYVQNFGTILIDFAQTTMFIPALITSVAAILLWRDASGGVRERGKQVASLLTFLWLFVGVLVGMVSGNAILHQRYYLMPMPLFIMVFILGVHLCSMLLAEKISQTEWPKLYRGIVIGLSATIIAPLWSSWPYIVGHIRELQHPYQGTIDVTVSYIRAHYTDPSQLTIATNYEEHAYMYYLKSRVIIGQVLNNLPKDTTYQPDIIIPRQYWKFAAYPYFEQFRSQAPYKEVGFGIRDFYVNNLPELRHPKLFHQFETRTVEGGEPLRMYVLEPQAPKP